jgi:hypothetical protein
MENELLLRQSWIQYRETRIFYKEEVKYARDSIYSNQINTGVKPLRKFVENELVSIKC